MFAVAATHWLWKTSLKIFKKLFLKGGFLLAFSWFYTPLMLWVVNVVQLNLCLLIFISPILLVKHFLTSVFLIEVCLHASIMKSRFRGNIVSLLSFCASALQSRLYNPLDVQWVTSRPDSADVSLLVVVWSAAKITSRYFISCREKIQWGHDGFDMRMKNF